MSAFDAATARQLAGGVVRPGVFLFIDGADGPLRIGTTFGDRRVAPDLVDTAGGIYTGIGQLEGLPAINQLINGIAQRIEFTLPGCDEDLLALADSEANGVRGAAAFMGFTAFDEDWQPLFDPLWLVELTIDVLRVEFNGRQSTITLSAGTANTNRKRPSLARYTGSDQRRRKPDDAFCDRTSLYAGNTTLRWPR